MLNRGVARRGRVAIRRIHHSAFSFEFPMSRRITLAILLTVWAMLIAGGGVAYWTTRSLLLADLDEALVGQALARPELVPTARRPAGSPTALRDGERFRIQNGVDGRRLRAAAGAAEGPEPQLVGATFSTRADGERQRTVTVRAWARPEAAGGEPTPVIVTYTGSAEAFHHLLNQLALTL